ncbi:MAG: hypothetical protein AB8C95_13930 [Phycisphaeraceae bacterium]
MPAPPPRPIGEPSIEPLIEQAVQTLSEDLLKVPAVRESKHRLVLMLSKPAEATNTDDRSAVLMRQLQNGLVQNQSFSRLFRVVNAPTSDPAKLQEILGGKSKDDTVLPDSDEDTGPAVYDPRDLYLLSARYAEQDRFTERRFTISLRVDHPQKSQTVLVKDVKMVFVWDPNLLQWLELR